MQVRAVFGMIQEVAADAIVLGLYEGADVSSGAPGAVDAALGGAIASLVEAGDFTGEGAQTAVLYTRGQIPAPRVILVGLGKQEEFALETARRAAASAIVVARGLKLNHIAMALYGAGEGGLSVADAACVVAEGGLLAAYHYQAAKKKEDPRKTGPELLELVAAAEADVTVVQEAVTRAEHLVAGVTIARDLVNLPPNFCTPAHMADTAMAIGNETGLRVQVLERGQMQALGMGALLAVAQGSDTPPRFIIMEHNAARAGELPSIVLVGKGITFDTGGYNLKTGDGMATMKTDMAGGAAVMGALRAVAGMNLPLHVVGLIPAADNMINGHAYRASEVVTASDGTTIEIISTDAEGRMLLADALVFADRFKPVAVVDIATLTGACVVALGKGIAAGLFSTDDTLRDVLLAASAATSEKLWPLPLFPEYEKLLESDVADCKHAVSNGGVGSSAMFLKRFTSYPWAHVDMAGMAADFKDVPYASTGATGYGVRLLAEFVRRWPR